MLILFGFHFLLGQISQTYYAIHIVQSRQVWAQLQYEDAYELNIIEKGGGPAVEEAGRGRSMQAECKQNVSRSQASERRC